MTTPTDLEILKVIRDYYYNAFASFDNNVPSRLTKIYVPIDVDLIARKFGVDSDIIFGRLYYHLDRKYSYKNDDGSTVRFFANSLGSKPNAEKHLINFPLLDAVLSEMQAQIQPESRPRDFYERVLFYLFERRDTNELHNLFDMSDDQKEREIIRSRAKDLHSRKLIEFGPSDLAMGFYPSQKKKFDTKDNSKERIWKYQNVLKARITLRGVEYVKSNLLGNQLPPLPPPLNKISQSLSTHNEHSKIEKSTIARWYNRLNTFGKVIIWILTVLASLATIFQVLISL